MSDTVSIQKKVMIFGIPFLIMGLMLFITKTTWFQINPNPLSIGITFDLLFIAPFIYFLLIRKTNIPKTTTIPVLIIGIVICSVILPTQNQYYLTLFKTWVLPIVELFALSFVVFNVRKALKAYKLKKESSVDFYEALKNTCYDLLPKSVVIPVVTEIAVFYYGFIHWRKTELKDHEFSYHKNSESIPLFIAVILIVAIETVTLHNLLAKWSNFIAWVLTFLSIYSGIQFFGFLKSILKRPILIVNNKLFLRYGIMNETTIELNNIASIELSSKDIELNKQTRKLSLLGVLESHNVVIHLKKENTLIGLYGIKRKFKTLAFYVDNKNEFKNQVDLALIQT
jgi:uncharacterized membrane protein YidH (DUF202 family)